MIRYSLALIGALLVVIGLLFIYAFGVVFGLGNFIAFLVVACLTLIIWGPRG